MPDSELKPSERISELYRKFNKDNGISSFEAKVVAIIKYLDESRTTPSDEEILPIMCVKKELEGCDTHCGCHKCKPVNESNCEHDFQYNGEIKGIAECSICGKSQLDKKPSPTTNEVDTLQDFLIHNTAMFYDEAVDYADIIIKEGYSKSKSMRLDEEELYYILRELPMKFAGAGDKIGNRFLVEEIESIAKAICAKFAAPRVYTCDRCKCDLSDFRLCPNCMPKAELEKPQ